MGYLSTCLEKVGAAATQSLVSPRDHQNPGLAILTSFSNPNLIDKVCHNSLLCQFKVLSYVMFSDLFATFFFNYFSSTSRYLRTPAVSNQASLNVETTKFSINSILIIAMDNISMSLQTNISFQSTLRLLELLLGLKLYTISIRFCVTYPCKNYNYAMWCFVMYCNWPA